MTKGHIARAVLEATAFQTREVVEAMNADAGLPLTVLRADGGMTVDNLLMQILADTLAVPIVRPMVAETTASARRMRPGSRSATGRTWTTLRANWHKAAEWRPGMAAERGPPVPELAKGRPADHGLAEEDEAQAED